jgi:hypothetical protein
MITKFQNLTYKIFVPDIINKYGIDDAIEFLKFLFLNKNVKMFLPKFSKKADKGTVRHIQKYKDDLIGISIFQNRSTAIIVNDAHIISDEPLDVNLADMMVQAKKFNL